MSETGRDQGLPADPCGRAHMEREHASWQRLTEAIAVILRPSRARRREPVTSCGGRRLTSASTRTARSRRAPGRGRRGHAASPTPTPAAACGWSWVDSTRRRTPAVMSAVALAERSRPRCARRLPRPAPRSPLRRRDHDHPRARIGLSVTMFSVLSAVELEPLPYARQQELVRMSTHLIRRTGGTAGRSPTSSIGTSKPHLRGITFYR